MSSQVAATSQAAETDVRDRPPAGSPPDTAERLLAPRLMMAATAAFVLLFSILVLYKHAHLGTRAFDLAIFDQGLWLLSQGETPFVTVRGLHLFADHTSFLLIPLVPLYWIWADVRVLLILTVLAMAAGGPLVYAAARGEGLERRMAAALGTSFLLLPAVQWQIWDVFHPEALAVPLLLAAYVLAQRCRGGWALAMLAVVLLAKEDAALVVVPLSIYLGWRFRAKWLAIGGTILGVAALFLSFWVLLPHWSPTGELIYTGRYQAFGDSMAEIMWGVLTSPVEVVKTALSDGGWLYLIGLLLPAALALLAPEVLLIGVPTLLANLLSRHFYQAELRYHYTAYLIAVVAIAAVVGTRRLLAWQSRRSGGWPRTIISGLIAAALLGSVIGGPWGIGNANPWAGHAPRSDLVAEALAVIPADGAVAADSRVVPHLAHRRTVYVFPNPIVLSNWSAGNYDRPEPDDFDWLVVRSDLVGMDEEFLDAFRRVVVSGAFQTVIRNDELMVLHRRPGSPPHDPG